MKTRIYLVRHGQSLGNLNLQMLGHTDLDLSELGYRQAERTFEYLKDVHFDAVYTSPLKRAFHTILPHAEARGLTPVALDDLREIYLGLWEDMYLADILHRWPYTFTEMWRANFGLCTPPKGEYVQDAATRCLDGTNGSRRRSRRYFPRRMRKDRRHPARMRWQGLSVYDERRGHRSGL